MKAKMLSGLLATSLSICLSIGPLPSSEASTEIRPATTNQYFEPPLGQMTLLEEARNLQESDLPREQVTQDGESFYVYQLGTGMRLAMPAALTTPVPYVSAGPSLRGPWIELTPTEQLMVAGGTAGFISAALCGGSFGVACGLAAAISGAAIAYISDKGICPNEKRLLVELTWTGTLRGAQCR